MNEIIIIILAWYESQSLRTPRLPPSQPADHDPLRWQELGARARFDYVGNTSGPRAPQFPLQQQQKRGSTPKMMWQEQGGERGGCCNRQTASSQKEIWTAAGGSCSFLPFAWRVHLCVMRAIFRALFALLKGYSLFKSVFEITEKFSF